MTKEEFIKILGKHKLAPEKAEWAWRYVGNPDGLTKQMAEDIAGRIFIVLQGAPGGPTQDYNDQIYSAVRDAESAGGAKTTADGGKKTPQQQAQQATQDATDRRALDRQSKAEQLAKRLYDSPTAPKGVPLEVITRIAKQQLELLNDDVAQAEIATLGQVTVGVQALDSISQRAGKAVTFEQLQSAIDAYNRRQTDSRLKINSTSDAVLRYGTDALFTSALNTSALVNQVRYTVEVSDRSGNSFTAPSDRFVKLQSALGADTQSSVFGHVVGEALAEQQRRVTPNGANNPARWEWEAYVPFLMNVYSRPKGFISNIGGPDFEASSQDPEALDALDRTMEAHGYVERYRAQLARYGDEHPIAALVALKDQDLAEKMVTVGLNKQELVRAMRLLGGDPADKGLTGDDLNYYSESFLKDGAGGGGIQVVQPDRNKIAEGFRELYRSWFKVDPKDEELQGLIDEIAGQYIGAQYARTEYDAGAGMVAAARKTDLYQRLFANKTSGATEEQYVGQFEGAARQLLGNELADGGSIQAGLQTGSVGTTIGAVAASKQAYDNSTFRDRLARAAEVVARLT